MVLRQSLTSFSVIKQRLILQQYRVPLQTGVRFFSSSAVNKNNSNKKNNNVKKDQED